MRPLDQRELVNARVVAMLGEPKTVEQIEKATGAEFDPASIALPKGGFLFEQRDRDGEPLFMVANQPTSPPGRVWGLWRAKRDPYLWVQFPRSYPHGEIRIVPLSDVHYGAKAHSKKRFLEYVDWIKENDDVFTFLNGDIVENAVDGSVGGAVYESNLNPEEQLWGNESDPGIIEILRPIAHKILWAIPGNHEWRSWKRVGIDPLRIVCGSLLVPYFNQPIYADVLAWGHRFTFFCHHGSTGSQTKGGKLNAANRPSEFQEPVDFVIMGHVHDSMMNDVTRVVRRRVLDERGKIVDFRIETRSQHVVICPSFHGYFGSYGAREGYAPGSWGSVCCTLGRDGSYRSSE